MPFNRTIDIEANIQAIGSREIYSYTKEELKQVTEKPKQGNKRDRKERERRKYPE